MTKENLKGIIKKILKRKAKKLPGFQKYLNQEKDIFPHLQGETPEISTKIRSIQHHLVVILNPLRPGQVIFSFRILLQFSPLDNIKDNAIKTTNRNLSFKKAINIPHKNEDELKTTWGFCHSPTAFVSKQSQYLTSKDREAGSKGEKKFGFGLSFNSYKSHSM